MQHNRRETEMKGVGGEEFIPRLINNFRYIDCCILEGAEIKFDIVF